MSAIADEIRAAVPMDVRRVAVLLGLKVDRGARADRARILCPFHPEKRPSCSIRIDRGECLVYCFACRTGGDVFTIVAATRALDARRDFPRVLEAAAEIFDVRIEPRSGRRTTGRRSVPRPTDDPEIVAAVMLEDLGTRWTSGRDITAADDVAWRELSSDDRLAAHDLLLDHDAAHAAERAEARHKEDLRRAAQIMLDRLSALELERLEKAWRAA